MTVSQPFGEGRWSLGLADCGGRGLAAHIHSSLPPTTPPRTSGTHQHLITRLRTLLKSIMARTWYTHLPQLHQGDAVPACQEHTVKFRAAVTSASSVRGSCLVH